MSLSSEILEGILKEVDLRMRSEHPTPAPGFCGEMSRCGWGGSRNDFIMALRKGDDEALNWLKDMQESLLMGASMSLNETPGTPLKPASMRTEVQVRFEGASGEIEKEILAYLLDTMCLEAEKQKELIPTDKEPQLVAA
jgi:hypothetical protein